MKELDYGKGYQYAHDEPDARRRTWTACPDELQGRQYYEPTDRGFEKEIKRRLDGWKAIKASGRDPGPPVSRALPPSDPLEASSSSRRVRRSITGRPCGHTVE